MGFTWIASNLVAQKEAPPSLTPDVSAKTTRTEFCAGLAGSAFRIQLGERYSREAAVYECVAAEIGGKLFPITFGGSSSVTVPAGGEVCSDAVNTPVVQGRKIAIWMYNSSTTGSSVCLLGQTHSTRGNYCGKLFEPERYEPQLPPGMSFTEKLAGFVGLEILADEHSSGIIAFGDSITEQDYWVSRLRDKVQALNSHLAVHNLGIGGNRLLRDTHFPMAPGMQNFGKAGLERQKWDIYGRRGIKTILLALGINDISQPGGTPGLSPPAEEVCTLGELQDGYRQFVKKAHSEGMKVVGCTITPFGGYITFTEQRETLRRQINNWILASGTFDTVVDFAGAVQDTARPEHLLQRYDSGDNLHPNEAGGEAMANCIDVQQLIKLTTKGL